MISRPLKIEMIRAELRAKRDKELKLNGYFDDDDDEIDYQPHRRLLLVKEAGRWMFHDTPHLELRQLFGNFWLEGELCILFADTNLGKSILAVQIADSLTRNISIAPFTNNFIPDPKVLYIDCELSTRQFIDRYKDEHWGNHDFSDNFYRGELNPDDDMPLKGYEKHIRDELEIALNATQAQVLIIDNITYLRQNTQHANTAQTLMKMLKAIKTRFNLSVLVLAHTPKRNAQHPLTVNDLQGSKMLINFADSAFAIGQSQIRPHLRYLKQIKQRSRDEDYGPDNILLMSRETEYSLLRFKFEGFGNEADHLRKPEDDAHAMERRMVLKLHKQGKSLRQIGKEIGMHFTAVGKIVRRAKMREKVEK